jgi:hypothetical protein
MTTGMTSGVIMQQQQGTATDGQMRRQPKGVWAGYSPREPIPLGGYAVLMGTWLTGMGGFLALANRRLPERIRPSDFLLLAFATHKLARIVTRDWVTGPIRAPFVEYKESIGGGEVKEKARGRGLRRAIGDLLTCPWCISPWVAGGLFAAFTLRPRVTRFLAILFSAVAVSDALQHLYIVEKRLSH